MKNFEKHKTTAERVTAHKKWCDGHHDSCDSICGCCGIKWLDLEAEEEKPMPCPFCNNEYVEVGKGVTGTRKVECVCGYSSQAKESESEAIAAHNRVARAVAKNNNENK